MALHPLWTVSPAGVPGGEVGGGLSQQRTQPAHDPGYDVIVARPGHSLATQRLPFDDLFSPHNKGDLQPGNPRHP
jgi:hypothetical protein